MPLLNMPRNYQEGDRILTDLDGEEFGKASEEIGVPVQWLLGLAFAESWDRYGERWGDWNLGYVRGFIAAFTGSVESIYTPDQARQKLQEIINEINSGPNPYDISFGRSQRIVLYHEEGVQGTPEERHTAENVLAVRAAVFADPQKDLTAMTQRFKEALDAAGGNPLLACVRYNGGPSAVTQRGDQLLIAPWYSQKFGGHIRVYSIALAAAERYLAPAEPPAEPAQAAPEGPVGPQNRQPDRERVSRALDILWGWKNGVAHLNGGAAMEMEAAIVAIKEEHGYP